MATLKKVALVQGLWAQGSRLQPPSPALLKTARTEMTRFSATPGAFRPTHTQGHLALQRPGRFLAGGSAERVLEAKAAVGRKWFEWSGSTFRVWTPYQRAKRGGTF